MYTEKGGKMWMIRWRKKKGVMKRLNKIGKSTRRRSALCIYVRDAFVFAMEELISKKKKKVTRWSCVCKRKRDAGEYVSACVCICVVEESRDFDERDRFVWYVEHKWKLTSNACGCGVDRVCSRKSTPAMHFRCCCNSRK